MIDELVHLSATEMIAAMRKRSLSPVEIALAHIARIEAVNPRINAFATQTPELALAAAREAEVRYASGRPAALDGVPLTVKGTLMIKGLPFRRGSNATDDRPMTESAPVVDRVLALGAGLLGITTTPEFGAGPVTISPLTGITRNPWDLRCNSGGSSGGAAAAVSSGMGPLALATDAGGSSRIPAALCGVVGFKPTGGRLPTYPPNVAGTMSAPGLIARDVRDVALLMNAVDHPDPRDAESLPARQHDYVAALAQPLATRHGGSSLRIALSLTLGIAKKVEPEIAQCLRRAGQHFESLGFIVEEADPGITDPIDIYLTLFHAGFAYSTQHFSDAQLGSLGPVLRDAIEAGKKISMFEYMAAQDARRAYARRLQEFHGRYDLLLTPTTAAPAFEADRWVPKAFEQFDNWRAWVPFTSLPNLTQQPAISLPAGLTGAGLPIGVQLAGARFNDDLVLRAAHLFLETQSSPVGHPPLGAVTSTSAARA